MGDVNLDLETEFMNKCRERFPYALAFRPASEPEPPRVPTPPPGTTAISDYMEQNYPVCPTMEKY